MARLYLCTSFERVEEMRRHREELRGLGHHVTSRWIDLSDGMDDKEIMEDPRMAQGFAVDDIADIMSADAMLMFTGISSTTGGYHTEFGVALMIGKHVIIIGPRENIFQAYQGVDQFDTWAKFMTHARRLSATSDSPSGSSEESSSGTAGSSETPNG